MSVFVPYLLMLAVVVGIVCAAVIHGSRCRPDDVIHPEERERREAERREERLRRQQERFYRQQSWRFWHDFFNR